MFSIAPLFHVIVRTQDDALTASRAHTDRLKTQSALVRLLEREVAVSPTRAKSIAADLCRLASSRGGAA